MNDSEKEALYRLIGTRIKEARKKSGYNQKELADIIGLTRTSIVNIEKGRHRLPLHILYTIALKLNIEPNVLIPTLKEFQHPISDNNLIEHVHDLDLNKAEKDSIEELLKKT